MRSLLDLRCGILCSSALLIIGLSALCIFPPIFRFFVNKEFGLSPESQSFRHWRRTPLPMTLDVYMFNWTNADRMAQGEKPKFDEIGPYRFYEIREKVNITWNSNGTVSYRMRRTWHFDEAESGPGRTLDDPVTTINGVSLTAAFRARQARFGLKASINMGFMFTSQRVWVSRTVGDLLFDGYEDPLMTAASSPLASYTSVSSPFDKFGWFYKKNDSFTYDGWFTIETGARDISALGVLTRWNGRTRTGFYEGECGAVRGYTGDLFPPGAVRPDSLLELFSHDLCRSLPFVYGGEATVAGLRALRFKAAFGRPEPSLPDAESPDALCYCAGECVPSGFLNLTACRYGAPVFVSLPHFHGARERFYLDAVEGLRPEPDKHEFHIDIEPTYGIPVNVGARIQINMLLQKIPGISLYKSVPRRMMVPVLWADQRVRITAPLAAELRAVVLLPDVVRGAGVATLCAGLILLAAVLWLARARRPAPATATAPEVTGHVRQEVVKQ